MALSQAYIAILVYRIYVAGQIRSSAEDVLIVERGLLVTCNLQATWSTHGLD
jgi:hypothetical protein